MQKTRFTKALSVIVCVVLTAAMALLASGCNDNQTPTETPLVIGGVKGEGETIFPFEVTKPDGTKVSYEVHTDKNTVGEALLDAGLIAGEDGAYGLYVKTVDGVTLDYDKDGMYWSFYINGEYAMSGVDTTDITADTVYAFKVEKA